VQVVVARSTFLAFARAGTAEKMNLVDGALVRFVLLSRLCWLGPRGPESAGPHRAYLFRPLEDGLERYVLHKWSGEFQFAVSQ
jgi:hypothetical protein